VKLLDKTLDRLATLAKKPGMPYFWPVVFGFGMLAGAGITSLVRLVTPPSNEAAVVPVIAAGIATSAFVLGLLTYTFNWRKSKKDLFISIHDKLIDPGVQKGRKVLFDQVTEMWSVRGLSDDDRDSANRALALYDTLAMYYSRDNVFKDEVLETWGLAMHKRADAIRAFIDYREFTDRYRSWPHLTAMLDDLEKDPPK
jgi:hypothetical protein